MQFRIVSRGINKRRACYIAGRVFTIYVLDAAPMRQRIQLASKRRADDYNLGGGIEESCHFSRGDLATANHQATPSSDIEKYRKISHRFDCT
jgi:hypothetical protein